VTNPACLEKIKATIDTQENYRNKTMYRRLGQWFLLRDMELTKRESRLKKPKN